MRIVIVKIKKFQIIGNTRNCWSIYIGELCAITTVLYWIRKQKHISCINFYYTLKKTVSFVSGQHTTIANDYYRGGESQQQR